MSSDSDNYSTAQTNSDVDDSDLDYNNIYRTWTYIVRSRSTCITNIYHIQEKLIKETLEPLDYDDIARALHTRNLLCQTKVIQISSNKKFVSIQFNISTMMETFCTEPLKSQDYSVQFKPDFRKRPRVNIEYEYISFLNVPSEVDEDAMTDFVKQYATVVGNPQYPQKSLDGIHYMTGTRVYRVHSITKHIPRIVEIFGCKIKCIYTS